MEKIEFEDRVIYRAKKGKKVKFVGDKSTYGEIVVQPNDARQVEEVDG